MVSQQRQDSDIPMVTLALLLVRFDQGRFSISLPLLQSQKRFLATSANKAFEINHPARCSPLLQWKGGVLANAAEIFLFFLSAPYNNPAVWFAKGFWKWAQKKQQTFFKIYCLCAAVMGGGIKLSAVFQMEFICNRFLFAFQFNPFICGYVSIIDNPFHFLFNWSFSQSNYAFGYQFWNKTSCLHHKSSHSSDKRR